MPIVKIVLDDRGRGKTSDAKVWFMSQPSPKAYIVPSHNYLKNLNLDDFDKSYGNLLFLTEGTLNRLLGLDLKAIVIDEFDGFSNPVNVLKAVLAHVHAKIYICGVPKVGAGISPIMCLAMYLDSEQWPTGFGKLQLGPEIIYGTTEIAKAAKDMHYMLNVFNIIGKKFFICWFCEERMNKNDIHSDER